MSTWTNTITGDYRQGQYGSTRYSATLSFGSPGIDTSSYKIISATLALVAEPAGKSGERNLYLRQGSTSGSLLYQSGTTLYTVNRNPDDLSATLTNTLTLNVSDSTHLSAILAGTFYLYVNSTTDYYMFNEGTSSQYSNAYTRFSSATLTIEYEPLLNLHYYNGSAWKDVKAVYYYNGSAWKDVSNVGYYNGTSWV